MKKLFVILTLSLYTAGWTDNPIVQTNFTPDPAALVYNDTLFVYTGHDEDEIENGFFTMYDWRVYSTTDMVNYTDHGSPLSWDTFSWGNAKAWAAQAIYRDGKFFWYVTVGLPGSNQPAIGVAVSDTPTGPFEDAIGGPLVSQSWDDIDPTVFIDDDGQAYMYWGNPRLYYVRLNEDMISYSGDIETIEMTTESFGSRSGDEERETTYEEGPWFFKRGQLYYMVFAAGPLPETIGYSTSPGPTGPWTYRGKIMSQTNTGSFTNHPAIVEYKGKGYFFYHTGRLPDGGGYHRSTAVESFDFLPDGGIPEITMSTEGPDPIATLNPYNRVEAETMSWSQGLKVNSSLAGDIYISEIDEGDYIKISEVNFTESGAKNFILNYASSLAGGSIDLHLDSQSGPIIGSFPIENTGGLSSWTVDSTEVNSVAGIHNLFLVFRGSGYQIDYWTFSQGIVVPAARDSIFNGDFSQESTGWQLNVWDGAANGSVEEGEYRLDITEVSTTQHDIQLIQNGIILQQGQSYELSFDAWAESDRQIEVNVEQDISPWQTYLSSEQSFNLSSTKQTFRLPFTMTEATDSNSRVSLNVGLSTSNVFFDNIQIQEIEGPVSDWKTKGIRSFQWQKTHNGTQLSLQNSLGELVQFQVLDFQGRVLATGQSMQTVITIDFSSFPEGVYVVQTRFRNLNSTTIFPTLH